MQKNDIIFKFYIQNRPVQRLQQQEIINVPLWVVVYRLYKLCLCFDLQINHTINNNPALEISKLNIYKTICDSLLTLVLTGCIIKSGFRSASVNCRRLRPIVNRQREDNELLCYHRLPRDKNVQLKDHFWSLLKITKQLGSFQRRSFS